jgi:hypothetical protein
MRLVPRFILGLLLALGVVTSAAADTQDGKTPSTAMPLSSIAGTSIIGSTAGSFAYYTINYPGNGSSGLLTVGYSPLDNSLDAAVGVNVWQGATLLTTANGDNSAVGASSVSFSSATAGPVLIQLYNYNNGAPMYFQLSLTGVTQAPAAAPAPAPAAAAPAPAPAPPQAAPPAAASGNGTSASSPIALSEPVNGVIQGSSAGSYQYYSATYPGDSSTRTVTFSFAPSGPDAANALFVNVYQAGNLIVSGQGTSTSTIGVLTVSYDSASASPILIQVANYNAATPISYTISD